MQSQRDFIAAVSHECKAPLAAILSSAEMIESKISLNTSTEKNKLVITIIDHGIGISDKDKPFIFNRFYQCDKSRTQKVHFGLGLSIANELVNKK